jgi:4-hydroxy-3-methylbut-2-enyl diphosphate reductase IspH
VETAAELELSKFTGRETVGVLTGASTPTFSLTHNHWQGSKWGI